jgi:hypothetical protein
MNFVWNLLMITFLLLLPWPFTDTTHLYRASPFSLPRPLTQPRAASGKAVKQLLILYGAIPTRELDLFRRLDI